jgi:hypothetical protein
MLRPKPISASSVGAASSAVVAAAQPPPPPPRDGMKVLVTGASGATGSRVVRELLADGSFVRALVRDRARGVAALEKVGVAPADHEGRLEIIVTDIYNLPPAVFDGVSAVISCTGTRVGPTGDTPDRALYLQGLEFFEPTILEDTPENVEYRGIQFLAKGAAAAFSDSAEERTLVPVLRHEDSPEFSATWGSLDDLVMGGVSQSSVRAENGELVFSGSISTKNSGGFASARTVNFSKALDLSGCSGMHIRVKGDGKRYKFIARCDERWDGIAHCVSFDTIDGEWIDVDMPWTRFNTVFRADTLPDGESIKPGKISALQIMLSKFEYNRELNPKFTPGTFELRVGMVNGMKALNARGSAGGSPYPKFVAVSSAGATRYFRKDEFPQEDQLPPAVRMNDMLGRIMEWKLSGEDSLRMELKDAGGYVIVRPCALTEKEPVGSESLRIEQGDNMTGQIGRDDLSRLLVELLYKPKKNFTFEVAEVRPAVRVQSVDNVVELEMDKPQERRFASFPYLPK